MFEQLTSEQILFLLLRFSIEAILLSAAMLFAWFKLGLRDAVRRLGVWQARIVFGFVVLLTVTQLVDRWQYHFPSRVSFYPLARFAMYQTGTAKNVVDSYRVEAEFNSRWQEINVSKELSAVGLPSMSTRFRVIASKLASDDEFQNEWAQQQLRLYFDGITELHRRRGKEVPESIRFVVEEWNAEKQTKIDLGSFEYQRESRP